MPAPKIIISDNPKIIAPFLTSMLPLFLLLLILCSCSFPKFRKTAYIPASVTDTTNIRKALSVSAAEMQSKTGVYALENGGKSLLTRLWFIEHAKKSIDIQYYSFSNEATGLAACDYILRAADRGVKVRILIDDAACLLYSNEVEALDSHENIDIFVYNAGLMLGRVDRRVYRLAKNYNRLLRRMHNKTITVDEEYCIMGGRNVANQYFDYDKKFNFRDRDVLLMGREVKSVRNAFQKFLNDSLTLPYAVLSGKDHEKVKKDTEHFNRVHKKALELFPVRLRDSVEVFPAEFRAAISSGNLVWVKDIAFISDKPGKNDDKKNRVGGICSDSITSLINQATTSIDIQSPYFILTDETRKAIGDAISRGVKIRLLTNSLASIDNIEAFSGYQKDRNAILKSGVNIYEFKPDSKVRFKLMFPEVQAGLHYKPVYGLHSKTLIIDKHISIVGSYNMDPRSANYNTECITVIRSGEFAGNLAKFVEEEFLPENAWQTTLDQNYDSEASIRKRVKAFTRKALPRKLL